MRMGRVRELRRYPVKSMLGESVASIDVAKRGVVGDRVCALLDEQTGRLASAKLPRRWRDLLSFASRLLEDGKTVEIAFPDGTRVAADESAARAISDLLGRDVRFVFDRPEGVEIERADPVAVDAEGLAAEVRSITMHIGMAAPEGGFFDAFPIHLIATSSLRRVAEQFGPLALEALRYRPNIVIDCPDAPPFVENAWAGASLRFGEDLRLRVVMPTPRCAVPGLSHGDAPPARGLSLAIAELNKPEVPMLGSAPCLGAYAHVETCGHLAVGDEVLVVA